MGIWDGQQMNPLFHSSKTVAKNLPEVSRMNHHIAMEPLKILHANSNHVYHTNAITSSSQKQSEMLKGFLYI